MSLRSRFFYFAMLCGSVLLLGWSLNASAASKADVQTNVQVEELQEIKNLSQQGQHDRALNRVNAYLAMHPKDASARFIKGVILTEKNQTAEAIASFIALSEDHPELPEPYNNLAVLYAAQGQYDKAQAALEKAIRTHPSYAAAHDNLGDIYAKLASQAYDRALQLDRGNAHTPTKLALLKELHRSNKTSAMQVAVAEPTAVTEKPVTEKPVIKLPDVAVPIIEPSITKPPVLASPSIKIPALPIASSAPTVIDHRERDTKDILRTVHSWAQAWSAKRVKNYLAFYAPSFKTPEGESLAQWQATRTERIQRPKFIEVGVHQTEVSFADGTHATVTFIQSYRASHLQRSSKKTLSLVKSNGQWLIQEERSGK